MSLTPDGTRGDNAAVQHATAFRFRQSNGIIRPRQVRWYMDLIERYLLAVISPICEQRMFDPTSMTDSTASSAEPGAQDFERGSIALLADYLTPVMTGGVINELTATGGILIIGIGFNILGLIKVKVGNLLPALVVASILAFVF